MKEKLVFLASVETAAFTAIIVACGGNLELSSWAFLLVNGVTGTFETGKWLATRKHRGSKNNGVGYPDREKEPDISIGRGIWLTNPGTDQERLRVTVSQEEMDAMSAWQKKEMSEMFVGGVPADPYHYHETSERPASDEDRAELTPTMERLERATPQVTDMLSLFIWSKRLSPEERRERSVLISRARLHALVGQIDIDVD